MPVKQIPPRPSMNHCGNCNKDYEFPAQESSCPHGPRMEITYCSICGNFTEYACSDCRIQDKTVVYVCHKDVCQLEHEAAKRHVTNELFNRLDQIANDVCVFLLSYKSADAKAIIVRELRETANAAATQMRDKCVETAKQVVFAEAVRLGISAERAIALSSKTATALESLTLDVEQKEAK